MHLIFTSDEALANIELVLSWSIQYLEFEYRSRACDNHLADPGYVEMNDSFEFEVFCLLSGYQ